MFVGDNFDGVVAPVGVKCGWVVGDYILIAEGLLNVVESRMELVLIPARQKHAASGLGKIFQYWIAFGIRFER